MTTTVAAAPRVTLTDRQTEVLILMAQGHGMNVVARLMQVSVHTARDHLHQAMKHLGVTSGTHAVALAIAHGLIPVTAAIPSRGAS